MDKPVSRRVGFWIETLLPEAIYAFAQWDAPVFHLIGNTPRTEQQFAPAITFTLQANTPTRIIYNQLSSTFHQVINLPSLYQISINPHEDIVNISDFSIVDYSSIIGVDTFIAMDALTGSVWAEPLFDTITSQDAIIGDTYGSFNSDSVFISDAPGSVLSIRQSRTDVVVVSDVLSSELSALLVDSVTLLDVLIGSSELKGQLNDSVFLTENLTSILGAHTEAQDTIFITDSIAAGFIYSNIDEIILSDNLAGYLLAHTATTDFITANEILSSSYAVYGSLTDSCVLTDGLYGTLILVGDFEDNTLIVDALIDVNQKIVVINADTNAVSTYTFTQTVTDLAYFNGILYLAGPGGLYTLDSTSDVDGQINWTIKTGFSNLGTESLKRVHDINVQGRTNGTIQCNVIANRSGQKQSYGPFILPSASRASYRDGVIKIGKGISSDYLQFQVTGTGQAEIDQMRLVVIPLNRRR